MEVKKKNNNKKNYVYNNYYKVKCKECDEYYNEHNYYHLSSYKHNLNFIKNIGIPLDNLKVSEILKHENINNEDNRILIFKNYIVIVNKTKCILCNDNHKKNRNRIILFINKDNVMCGFCKSNLTRGIVEV